PLAVPTHTTTPSVGLRPVLPPALPSAVQVWHRYVDPSQSPADTTYSFLSSGVFLDKTVMKAGSQDATCAFSPPLPVPAWPPTVGATFAGKATCTGVSLTVTVKGRITGTKDVTIDGSVHHTFVLDATESISGAVTGTGTQVAWVDPATSLVLHEVNTLQGNYGVFSFSSTETGDLESTHPS
ncbi:MAG: hypothetical protein ACR2NJ_06265, partial [Acidimicrobiales bacterium]